LAFACNGCRHNNDFAPERPDGTTRFTETRTISERNVWLSWSKKEREKFVLGYIGGREQGTRDGCLASGIEDASPCFKTAYTRESWFQGLFSPDDIAKFEREITSFYSRHPEDDDVPIPYVISLATGEKRMTAEQVYLTMHGRP
jgi:hypothetical protein